MDTTLSDQSMKMPAPFPREALRTVLDCFYQWEAEQPQAAFLRQPRESDWITVTWAEAGDQARRIARALAAAGLEQGDKVGILSKNCAHWVIADLAIMMGGFVSVPFYPNLTAGQLKTVLEISDVKVLFAGKLDEWEDVKTGIPESVQLITFPHYPGNARVAEGRPWQALLEAHEPVQSPRVPGLDDLWTILFTSGTTGMPKGVMHNYYSHAALMYNEKINNNLKVFEGKTHRFFSYLPLNHIAERIIVETAAIMTGGSISFAESIDTFADNLRATEPTLFMSVPRIWTKFHLKILQRIPPSRLDFLLSLPLVAGLIKSRIRKALGLSSARILLTGSAPTPQTLKDWYDRLGLPLLEVYAMTENTGGCTLMPADHRKAGTVGKPLPNVSVRIDNQTGEVLTKAPWIMRGYYKDPEKTAHMLRDGWLHTGDQGELDEEGFLKLTGRVSDTFKSAKGKYVVPAPIEWKFASNNFIEHIAVVGLAIPQPLAMVVLSDIGRNSPRDEVTQSLLHILQEVNAELPNYEQVRAIIVTSRPWNVDNGLLTPTLKIRRNALNELYQRKYQEWYDRNSPIIWEG